MRKFDTGATRDTDDGKFDLEGFLCPLALERYAQYMHKHRKQADGKIRASDNWQRGLPIAECIKSMFRHFVDLWKLNRGYAAVDQKDGHYVSMEEACCAMIFNNFSILSTLEKENKNLIQPKHDLPKLFTEDQRPAWERAKDGDSIPCNAPSTSPNSPSVYDRPMDRDSIECASTPPFEKLNPPTQHGGAE